ncbi:MAG: fumarylacetoacetate hydrolase family protein [Parvularculaceae bacterium]
MKLLRYGPRGEEKPGLVDHDGGIRDLSVHVRDVAGETLSDAGLAALRAIDPASLPLVDGAPRIGPCVGDCRSFIGIGLNYADHAAEVGAKPPAEPIVFAKSTACIAGPDDDLVLPPGSTHTDWEVELGVVIGTGGARIEESAAIDHVAGYCVVHDVSEREHQLRRGGQWIKGKSADGFGPIGPWLVTRDEIPDPQDLRLWLEVDGRRFQNGSTSDMFFSVRTIVSYVSTFMTLRAGDVIATGTPAGVGQGQKPEPVFLRGGETVRLGVEGLGEQSQRVVAPF